MKEPNIEPGNWKAEGSMVRSKDGHSFIHLDCDNADHEGPTAQLLAASKEMAKLLDRIYMADKTGNNGAIMGEAVLCPYFSNAAHRLLLDAGYTDYEPTETSHEETKDN